MSIFFWQSWRKEKISASRRSPRNNFARPLLERLEDRVLLSASVATPDYIIYKLPDGQPDQSAAPVGFTPQQIRTAYGIDKLYGIIGDGKGQTIAIVDAYDNPAFVDTGSANFNNSDLHKFDVAFGLPDPPSFKKLGQDGSTTLPGTDPAGPPNDWEGEEALDVEWAHAIAPGANIVLVECNSPAGNDLFTGVATAAALPGVSVVSMSFGFSEVSGEQSADSVFTTPPGHIPVTFLASAGDSGSFDPSTGASPVVNYPAASPNVVGVGGTFLTLNADNSYGSEVAWGNGAQSGTQGGSGGGISQYETEPVYQESVQTTGKRTVPDVAFDADPNSGVAVYDSYDVGTATPWIQVGGTSLAAPSWAGLIAIADQGLVKLGKPTLDGPSQTLPDLYNLYQTKPSDFHDITSGSNGAFSAHPGYDEVTGLGTPAANLLIPDLIGYHLLVSGLPVSASEGQPLINVPVADFTDFTGAEPVGDYTATITWGDGTTSIGTVVAEGNNNFLVLGSHTYINAGVYPLTVTVVNQSGLSGSSTTAVHVADAPLNGFAQAINSQVGSYVNNALVAVFQDTDPTPRDASHYTATIQWIGVNGLAYTTVGRIVPLFNNTFAVYGDFPSSMAVGGLFAIQVTIRDVDGATVTVNSSLAVANNEAIPRLLPMSSTDLGPVNSQFVSMEDSLTNFLLAEQRFFIALAYGTPDQKMKGFNDFVAAYFAYRATVLNYDMGLPMA